MTLRVRFAPSPSGDLHVGNARTALFNYLYARHSGGTYVFRIEDSDADRSDEDSIRAILGSLEWLGLTPDEGEGLERRPHPPYRQSQALELYQKGAQALLDSGRAYWCFDLAEEQEAERERLLHAPQERKRRHPHRDLDAAGRERLLKEGRKPALRFATDDLDGEVGWDDGVRGPIRFELSEIRDFNLLRGDGTPMYNWACVIDDHRMGITDVLRGEDGISNTPRQLLLYRALGWEAPRYSHVSFILGPDGQKLSKRHGDTGISKFRAKGYLPEALLNYLGLLGLGGEGEGAEVFSLQDLVERFEPGRLVKKASVFDYGKLDFLNAHWLRAQEPKRLAALAAPFLEGLAVPSPEWLELAVETLKGNAVVLKDLRAPLEALLAPAGADPAVLAAARAFPDPKAPAQAALDRLSAQWPADEEGFKAALKEAQKTGGVKGKDFFMPLRLALTGSEHGPELPKLLNLLGLQRVQDRLKAYLAAV
jgi:nondiscriminating glutamyl-tRNA synthetase